MKEKEIVELIGKNHTTPLQFKKNRNEVYGIYTYKNKVYCFKDGRDIPFDEISDKEQKECLSLVKEKNYKENPSLQ